MISVRQVVWLLGWANSLVCLAQGTSSAIEGAVIGENGAFLANASVSIHNLDFGIERQLRTGTQGRFRAALLPAGSYQLAARSAGMGSARRDLVLGIAETRSVNLIVGSLPDSERAQAPAPVPVALDTIRTQPGTSINSRMVGSLPVSGRKFLDLGVMVVGATEFGERDSSATADFSGVNHFYSNMLVDGGDAYQAWTNFPRGKFLTPFEFSQDVVREIQVLNSNFPAEYGRSAGGLVNVVTRSGTNAWHGDGFYFFSDGAMNAAPRFATVKPDSRFQQFGGAVGGPAVKNRLFFFGGYDQIIQGSPLTVSSGTVMSNYPAILSAISDLAERQRVTQAADLLRSFTGEFRRDLDQIAFLTRGDWLPSANHTVGIRLNFQDFRVSNVPENGFTAPLVTGQALNNQGQAKIRNVSLVVQWSAVVSARTTNEARFHTAVTRENEAGNSTGVQVRIGSRNSGVTFGGSELFPRALDEDRLQWSDVISLDRGRHVFKAGADVQRLSDLSVGLPLESGAYQFNSLQDFANGRYQMYMQAFGLREDHIVSPFYGFFAQDEIRVRSGLNLNIGLRYEYQHLAQPTLSNPRFPQTAVIPQDKNNLAPRLGLSWAPTGLTTVRAGYGIYHAFLPLQVNSVARTDNGVFRSLSRLRFGAAGAPAYPAVLPARPGPQTPAPGGEIIVFHPDFASPYVQHASLEIERQVLPDLTLTGGWLASKGTRLRRNENANLFPPTTTVVQVRDTAQNQSGPVPIASFEGAPRPYPFFERINEFRFDSNSFFQSFFIQANKRYRLGLQLVANYTLAKVMDYEQAPGNQITCCTSENPFDHQKEHGLARRDQRHRFNLMSTWDVPGAQRRGFWGAVSRSWQLNGVARVGSGRPYSATIGGDSGGDLNGDGVQGDRAPTFDRSGFTGPGYASVDVALHRSISLGEGRRVSLGLETYNVFNRANYLRPSTEYFTLTNVPGGNKRLDGPSATFGAPLDVTRSRLLQFALRFYF